MYDKKERDEQITAMTKVSGDFYYAAARTDVHAFIEFTGLMNKFIDVCRNSSAAGVDFNESNTHTGDALVVEDHDLVYLAEKFDCIFGPTLADPKNRKVFFDAMGWNEKPALVEPVAPKCPHDRWPWEGCGKCTDDVSKRTVPLPTQAKPKKNARRSRS
jgi:hypothetical protein